MVIDKIPEGGELFFHVPVAPVSQQADGKSRRTFQANVKQHIPRTTFLFSGDVHLDLIWRCREVHKYESHKSVDLDNIAKPLIDSLVGELLIDDTQLVSVLISWVDWENESEALEIKLRSPSELISLKQGLEFAEFKRGLCLPIFDTRLEDGTMADPKKNAEVKLLFLDAFEKMLDAYEQWRGMVAQAHIVLPNQRVFHRNKIKERWPVIEATQMRTQLRTVLGR